MMEKFYFRVWNKKRKSMFYFGLFDETLPETIFKDFDKKSMNTTMQYTGLKDINNEEIFEGDICIVYLKDNLILQTEVIWDKEKASFKFKDNDNTLHTITETKIQVVGNIYEGITIFSKNVTL